MLGPELLTCLEADQTGLVPIPQAAGCVERLGHHPGGLPCHAGGQGGRGDDPHPQAGYLCASPDHELCGERLHDHVGG